MMFAMLLGSLNYGASLGFALTFLLTGLGLVVMQHCHNNLLGATIKFLGATPVFAGERAEFKIAVSNDAAAARFEIELKYRDHTAGPVDVAGGGTETLRLGVPTQRRGWVALERFRVETQYPARLCRAWTWIHMDTRCLVYPRPADPGRPLPLRRRRRNEQPARAGRRRLRGPANRGARRAAAAHRVEGIRAQRRLAAQGVLERQRRALPARLGHAPRLECRAAALATRALVSRRRCGRPQPRAAAAGLGGSARCRAEASRLVSRSAGAVRRGHGARGWRARR